MLRRKRLGFLLMNVSPQKNNGTIRYTMTHSRLSHLHVTAARREIVRLKRGSWIHHRQTGEMFYYNMANTPKTRDILSRRPVQQCAQRQTLHDA
jgi:hypothetical protein